MPSLAILELSEKIEAMPFNLKRKKKKKNTNSKKLSFQHEWYCQIQTNDERYLKVVTGWYYPASVIVQGAPY